MRYSGLRLGMLLERYDRRILSCLLSLILFSGALYSIHLGGELRYSDELRYYNLAENLAHQGSFSLDGRTPSIFRPPGYPLLMAPFILVGANVVQLRFLNFIALALSLLLVHHILRRQVAAPAGIIGAFLVIAYPVLFYTAGTLYPQIIAGLLLLWVLDLLTAAPLTRRRLIHAGLAFGLLILLVPAFVFTLVIMTLWLAFSRRPFRIRSAAAFALIALTVAGLWSVRNFAVFGRLVFVSANGGNNLLYGNSENTTPNSGMNTDISWYKREAGRLGLDEIREDAYYAEQAVKWIKGHPRQAFTLYWQKVLNHFNYRNDLYTGREASAFKDLVMLFTYGPLLLLLILRLILSKRLKWSRFEVLLLILYFSSAFYYAIFFTRIRFRLPFDFLLIILAAVFLYQVIAGFESSGKIESRHSRKGFSPRRESLTV